MRSGGNRGVPWRRAALDLSAVALVACAAWCSLVLPPLMGFEPHRLPALALVTLGTILWVGGGFVLRTGETGLAHTANWAGLFRGRAGGLRGGTPLGASSGAGTSAGETGLAPTAAATPVSRPRRRTLWRSLQPRFQPLGLGGEAILWGVVAWCVFSQEAPLTADVAQVWGARALPLALASALWLWLRLPLDWQRRAVLGVTVPTMLALGLAGWPTSPRVEHFAPYYLASDSTGTLYVSDAHAAVIRVFAPGGALVAKLRPGLSSRQGPPGPGFFPPGPYNDPDQLGVARVTPGASSVTKPLQPWPVGADDFWFCGMAVGAHDRLFIPDWMRGRLLRFAPDGKLEAIWSLPTGFQPSLGCVTASASALYLDDTRGSIIQMDPQTGDTLASWSVGEPILGGISVGPAGEVYALAQARVYALDPASGRIRSWALPAPTGSLGEPYQALLATADGRVLIANLAARRVDIYSAAGVALGTLGGPGTMPGQFGQVGGLAAATHGALYVADSDSRAVQRFGSAGHIIGLYWSADDDEID